MHYELISYLEDKDSGMNVLSLPSRSIEKYESRLSNFVFRGENEGDAACRKRDIIKYFYPCMNRFNRHHSIVNRFTLKK